MEKHTYRPLYRELASAIEARRNCIESGNQEWKQKHSETIKLLLDLLPKGSGWDHGADIDLDASHAEKLVLFGSYHHMTDAGYYDGWTEHIIIVTPSFTGINLRISGRNHNDIKSSLYEMFDTSLRQDVTYHLFRDRFPQFAIESKWENEDGTPSQCFQAFYVAGIRFWNNLEDAQNYAADLMENELKGFR